MIPVAGLILVPGVEARLQWYQQAFSEAVPVHILDFGSTALDVNGFLLEIVESEKKVLRAKKEQWHIGL
ncbi:hypothetical protein [Vibrio sp. D449a]|uniref:hypothetical protein n=1 Tax=Vibrio sp. D449a TaxID=2837389 RepID=UPI00358E642D